MSANYEQSQDADPNAVRGRLPRFLMFAWSAIRMPVAAILASLEPVVGFILCAIATLTVVVSLILRFSGAVPHFPFWTAMGLSAALYLAFVLYTAVVRLLLR